jgi:hypothetical protein
MIQREMPMPDVITKTLDVEKHTFTLFKDLPQKAISIPAVLEMRR